MKKIIFLLALKYKLYLYNLKNVYGILLHLEKNLLLYHEKLF